MEEANAKPENQNQKDLVAFFKGDKDLSDWILKMFLEERDAENPNLPLIRKYFKNANQNLKTLILYGLDHYPGRVDLLSDLAYFHEFENILSILITYYTQACVDQENLETFSKLAQDFYLFLEYIYNLMGVRKGTFFCSKSSPSTLMIDRN
jgi:hypothetical protein